MKYFYAIAIGIMLFLSHDVISQVGYLSFVCDYSIINVKTQLINRPYDTLIIDNSLVLTVAWRHFCDTLQEYMLYCIIYIKTFIKQNLIVNHFFLQLTNWSWTFHYLFIRPSALILLYLIVMREDLPDFIDISYGLSFLEFFYLAHESTIVLFFYKCNNLFWSELGLFLNYFFTKMGVGFFTIGIKDWLFNTQPRLLFLYLLEQRLVKHSYILDFDIDLIFTWFQLEPLFFFGWYTSWFIFSFYVFFVIRIIFMINWQRLSTILLLSIKSFFYHKTILESIGMQRKAVRIGQEINVSFLNVFLTPTKYVVWFNPFLGGSLRLVGLMILTIPTFLYTINPLKSSLYIEALYLSGFNVTDSSLFNDWLLGLDGISILFIFLTLFIFGMVQISLGTKKLTIYHYKFLFLLVSFLELQLILTFFVQHLLLFYIFFESTLIPMFFIVGFYGTRSRKVFAAFYLFLYTIFGSLFLLIGILIIYVYTGTFFIPVIYQYIFSFETQVLLWILFFIGFAVKLPSIPFHLWLPEAHVEAPAVGSIILAAILLKLGGYGLLRISLKMLPDACLYFQPLVFVIAAISIIYASLTAVRQTDIKRIIAYSSIAHMNYILIGLFCFTKIALVGAFYLMVGHGLVSGGLFLLIGLLYERYGTRSIFYYGGLMKVMPYFCTVFLFLTLANMGFPGLVNFIGEFFIMLGMAEENILLFFLIGIGFILSAVYSIWLFNRLAFGNVKIGYLKKFHDLMDSEFKSHYIYILIFLILGFGIYTKLITVLIEPVLSYYLIDYNYNYNSTSSFMIDQHILLLNV